MQAKNGTKRLVMCIVGGREVGASKQESKEVGRQADSDKENQEEART